MAVLCFVFKYGRVTLGNLPSETNFPELLVVSLCKKDEFQVENILMHFSHEFTICGFIWVFPI